MTIAALDSFSVTRHAADPRADGARRTIRVSATAVTIERTLDGVRMRVGVPVAAYRGLVVAVQAPAGRAVLSLRHDDSDLDVVLGSGEADDVALSTIQRNHSQGNGLGRISGERRPC